MAVPTLGGTCLVLIAIALVVYLLIQGGLGSGDDATAGMLAEVTKLPPTASAGGPASEPSLPEVSCETLISSEDSETIASPPITLTVGSAMFPVVSVVPAEGLWQSPDGSGVAAWVCGTVVNYVIEIDPTQPNVDLLASLSSGDEIRLSLTNGTVLLFGLDEAPRTEEEVAHLLAQTRPRVTVLSRRDDDLWQVAIGAYLSEAESARPPVTALARVGEPVRVEDLLVLVSSAGEVRAGIELEPGTMVYLVEYAIENVGSEPWRTDWVITELQDGAGNRYLMSPMASGLGEFGPLLGGEVQPGTIVRASAGYVVPEDLSGPALIWTFAPRADAPTRVNVVISHELEAGVVRPGQFTVAITDAFLNMRGDVLHVLGEIRNAGEGPLVVGLSDISMTSSAGVSELHLAAPPLPWTVEPGQTQVFELQFARPNASAALLTILGYSFEIQGL